MPDTRNHRRNGNGALVCALVFPLVLAAPGFIGARGRVQEGNDLYAQGKYAEAGEVYGNLAVQMPDSPYVQYNLGLAQYSQGELDKAASAWQQGLESNGAGPELMENLHYNLGVCQYNQAENGTAANGAASGGADTGLLQQSLENFRQAVLENPNDLDAKYDYELVKKELKQAQDQQQSSGENSQDNQDQGNQGQNQDNQQQNQDNQGQDQNNQNQDQTGQDQQQSGQNDQSAGEDTQQNTGGEGQDNGTDNNPAYGGEMTPEQARALLDQAQNLERYGALAPPGYEQPVEKDW